MTHTNQYKIEHIIDTLLQCSIFESGTNPASFSIEDILFTHCDFNFRDGWVKKQWLATATIEESCWRKALSKFRKKLFNIVPKISFIGQAYIEFRYQPFLIQKIHNPVAYVKFVKTGDSVGLMFRENEKLALIRLLKKKKIPKEFYYYWIDAVNTIGYSAKLILLLSAIESMTKKPNGKPDYNKRIEILGEPLKNKLFGNKSRSNTALRNRLVHGEYFNDNDIIDYVQEVHKKIINYFNDTILTEPLINENVINPQRYPWGNYKTWNGFVKKVDNSTEFVLEDMLTNFENKGNARDIAYDVLDNVISY